MTPFEYLVQTEKKRFDDLFELLRFPSVSAKSEHKPDLVACAEWLKDHLSAVGFKTTVHSTGGHPLVYAEYFVDKKLPTALYYGHYDVQPPEPLNLWKTAPFEPQIRDGYIFARGSCDDKGQTFAQIKGLEAIIKATGTLPINVKFLIEGEEESHSVNLPAFIRKNRKLLISLSSPRRLNSTRRCRRLRLDCAVSRRPKYSCMVRIAMCIPDHLAEQSPIP